MNLDQISFPGIFPKEMIEILLNTIIFNMIHMTVFYTLMGQKESKFPTIWKYCNEFF